jgi:endonuclease/exonuclease/phosphatase family metal-dependent hydrolase
MRRLLGSSSAHARVVLVRLGVPLAIAAMVAAGSVHGSDSRPACIDRAPWVLAEPDGVGAAAHPTDTPTLDVATYNVHSGLGLSFALFRRRADVERNLRAIARSIAGAARDAAGPDVVALNEVDFGSRRSAWIDEPRFIADEVETITGTPYRVIRGETWRRDVPGFEVRFGNAALVRLPIVEATTCLFDDLAACGISSRPAVPPRRRNAGLLGRLLREPRGIIRLTVRRDERLVDVLVTHLDAFAAREREAQASALLSQVLRPDRTTVLLGDMNAVPTPLTSGRWMFSDDRTHAILATGGLADACISLASLRGQRSLAAWATYPADAPVWGLDWVLGSLDLAPEDAATIGGTASDHRGLAVLYRWLTDDAAIAGARRRHGSVCERLRAFDDACGPRGS